MSARLEFETRAKCEDFVARIKMIVSPMKLTVPSAAPNNYLGSPFQITWRPGDRKAVCAFVESVGRTAQSSLPSRRWSRCVYRPSARRPLTSSQHQGSKKRRWKTCVQTCPFWKWTVVYTCCTWPVCSWCYSWRVATCSLWSQQLKSYHNKIVWLKFVLMRNSWQQLKSDSISWRKTLQSSHNSQIQWLVVSTLCQERKEHRNPKVGSEGTPKLGPYWTLQLVACKVNMEWKIRIESMNKDHSHSWIRISHGLNKLITNLNDHEQETSEMQFEDYALKSNVLGFASRSKAKAKPPRRISAIPSTRTILIGERTWTDDWTTRLFAHRLFSIEETWFNLLRHGSLPRESDGAIEFWRRKDNLQKHFLYCHHWSDEKWKKSMAREGGGNKKKISILYWSIRTRKSLSPSSSRSFRTQSHWSYFIGQCH